MQLDDPHSETYKPTNMFYPLYWLERVGFFPNAKVNPLCNGDDGSNEYSVLSSYSGAEVSTGTAVLLVVVACAIGTAIGGAMGMRYQKRKTYSRVF